MTKHLFAATLLGGALAFALLPTGSSADESPGSSPDDLAVLAGEISAAELAAQSGGSDTDIDDININWQYTNQVSTGNVSDVTTGLIRGNTVSGNRGITATMYNTGNNVSFSSNIQLNVNMH